ncbi:MAG: TetR/AcrR family transcriptional regulator [Devosiaceae bacterium]|nr:TetR/AcrR family transcriptional regulator [Devosiaceae bacterium MH13]
MNRFEDPRLVATRAQALESALEILSLDGVLAVTHAAVAKRTGIARSTLYRHWPRVEALRNDAFKRAAHSDRRAPAARGELQADLVRLLGFLITALNETPWGKIAPQVIAVAATDGEAKSVIGDFMAERIDSVEAVFRDAQARGDLAADAPVREMVEMAIAVPYFRKLIAGLPIDEAWLARHVALVCRLADAPGSGRGSEPGLTPA